MKALSIVGETTITGRNRIALPANSLRELGWKTGDHLMVGVIGNDLLVLMRRPEGWTEAFAGRLTGVFGTHEENLRWLEEERSTWN